MRQRIEARWARFPKLTEGVKLVIIDYDFRDILTPLIDYIERVNHEEFPDQMITIVIPEFIPIETTARFLHNQTANLLQRSLLKYEDIVVIDIPYHLKVKNGTEGE